MGKIEFVVSWETRTRYSTRHYARFYDHLKDAQQKARKVKENPLTTACTIRQQEDNSTRECLKVRIISWNIPY